MAAGVTCTRCAGRLDEYVFDLARRTCARLGKPFMPPKVCAECLLVAIMETDDTDAAARGGTDA